MGNIISLHTSRIRKIIKGAGKIPVALHQKEETHIRQNALLVDGSFILPNNFALIVKDTREKFKNANLVVLTFKEKKEFMRDRFPDIEIVFPKERIRIKKYQLAIEFLRLLRKNFDFVILSSLDISLVSLSLLFTRCPVFLHNRWLEWYRLRTRTILDLLFGVRSADRGRPKKNRGMKDVIKSIGRIFALLVNIDKKDIQYPILIVDNGYTDIGHVSTAVRKTMKIFVNPEISILTFAHREHCFVDMFPELSVVSVRGSLARYGLAREMFRMRKLGFRRVVLTTLDISRAV